MPSPDPVLHPVVIKRRSYGNPAVDLPQSAAHGYMGTDPRARPRATGLPELEVAQYGY